jgi:hypothetical protein
MTDKDNMLLRHIGASFLLAGAFFATACVKPVVPQTACMPSPPSSTAYQTDDRQILAGEWEYVDGAIDGAVGRLTLDNQGNGHYNWKDGRFETHTLTGHTWRGMWFQKGNDRDGGFRVDFSQDFSKGEGCWWYSRIGADNAPTQKGGTFHLSKKAAPKDHKDTPSAP